MPDLRQLRILRDRVQEIEQELRRLRDRRDAMAVALAQNGFPERVIGENAGLSGVYVHQLKKRAKEGVTS